MAWKFRDYPDNWGEISRAVKERDGYRCQECGRQGGHGLRLNAHHKSKDGNDDLDNLITLCEDCHAALHPHLRNRERSFPSIPPIYPSAKKRSKKDGKWKEDMLSDAAMAVLEGIVFLVYYFLEIVGLIGVFIQERVKRWRNQQKG